MSYYIDLFSPETYEAFAKSPRDISGFRPRHKRKAERIVAGDVFVCYMTNLSRWCGLLEVVEGPFTDDKPIFLPESDPFVVRFRVRTRVWLDVEKTVPIHERTVWEHLSFTRGLEEGSTAWTGKVRGSLVRLDDSDGKFLADTLIAQANGGRVYPLEERESKKIATHQVQRIDKVVTVSIPDDFSADDEWRTAPEPVARESIRMQALIARIGEQMGHSVWVPRNDRSRVSQEWKDGSTKAIRLCAPSSRLM